MILKHRGTNAGSVKPKCMTRRQIVITYKQSLLCRGVKTKTGLRSRLAVSTGNDNKKGKADRQKVHKDTQKVITSPAGRNKMTGLLSLSVIDDLAGKGAAKFTLNITRRDHVQLFFYNNIPYLFFLRNMLFSCFIVKRFDITRTENAYSISSFSSTYDVTLFYVNGGLILAVFSSSLQQSILYH